MDRIGTLPSRASQSQISNSDYGTGGYSQYGDQYTRRPTGVASTFESNIGELAQSKRELSKQGTNSTKLRESQKRKSIFETLPKINQKLCYHAVDWNIPLDTLPYLERQVFQEKYYPFLQMINNNKFSRYLSGLSFFENLYNKNLLLGNDEKLKEFTDMSDDQISKLRVTAMQGWFSNADKKSC
jgi:hypothetical protein